MNAAEFLVFMLTCWALFCASIYFFLRAVTLLTGGRPARKTTRSKRRGRRPAKQAA